ncbi:amino acid adenylation domain-containing protein [Serratia marcescens]|mgnify:CR=1 FL=1|uniref:amino acid adenylation domain-containing protein n=1 Tax=Serratia marcescens TaxID=615 RepID=UPI003FA7B320
METLDADCDVGKLINTPFDLREGPLCRFYLIELAPQRYNLIIVVHHILIDGLSGQEFYSAVSAYYNRGTAVTPPQADETDISTLYRRYEADIAALKHEFGSASFWGDMLAECAPRVALPYLPGAAAEAPGAGEVRFALPFAEWQALKSGVRYANPFLIFKTLWALLIARQSAQETVHIGYPIAPEGGEALFFGAQVNTAVFPLTLAPGATFNQLYRATLAYSKALKVAGKLRHSQLPVYDMLSLSPVRQLNVNFTQAYLKDAPLALEGCRIGVNHRFNVDLAGSELLLEYQPTEQAFEFRLRYRPDLFDATQMAEMAEQYLWLLQRALTEPDAPIAAWPQLTAQQVLRCRDAWESGPATADAEATLLDGLARQARRHPERIAVTDAKGSLSYRQLARRSDRLALRLRAEYQRLRGVAMPPETLIPLYLQRSAEAVVAMLAIMKAGGAYVPLDPAAPAQRLDYILQEVNSPIVLTESALQAAAQRLAPGDLCLSADEPLADADAASLPRVDARQLAYVIYTSGTSGRPKGTLCEHRGAANMVLGHTQRLLRNEPDALNCLQFASLAFDAHVFEVFMALGNGHRLFIASEAQRRDPALLCEQMAAWCIEACFLPPALLGIFPELPASVRYLATGGEASAQEALDHYLARGMQVANMYGPTEASVSASLNIYRRNGARNIGHAIANMRCYVVDEHDNLLPLGAEGELCLAGVGLARGYLNLPTLTEAAFTANPFELREPYRRLYRTGDRVRRLADGSLEYLGRHDQQIKINGYRIELGEIEMQLRALPEVAEAVVSLRPGTADQLAAWYVPQPGAEPEAGDILQRLAAQLPHYMLPSAMRALAALPLTVSRKVDYRALPEPLPIEPQTAFRRPCSPLEIRLSALFNRLLGGDVGVDDNFFRLGGNSMMAIRLCHEVNKLPGAKISVLTLNQHPTVAALSEHIAAQRQAPPDELPILPGGLREAPLSLQQSRLWFVQQLSVNATHYLSPVLLRLSPDIDDERFAECLQAIVDEWGELSYGELYRRALTLSLQLRQHADMRADTIAVMVDKGRAQIIAVLAILMAGKAYLPLDGAWPERRRLDIVAQSQTRIILSSREWATSGEARLLTIDPQGAVTALPPAAPGEPVLPAPSALAYVIFTSGSTGAPKGVAIEHRGAVNSIIDTLRQLELGADDRGLALSALSFDISVFDIFGLLSVGGAIVMPSETERYQPEAWHRLLMTQGVTFWNSAPSVMTLLVEQLESAASQAQWPQLRNVVLVGEVISRQLPARIRQWRPGCRVVSAGGATESSIWSILYDIPETPILAPSVPYGQAMAHQRFYVLDRHLRVLPPCLPGEQYIGGIGVARGYYRNPSLTEEKFIYHPELGERLYRTGDAGRYLPDGNLEFLGRMDFQVKINGYRVELGEVEQCALAFGAIKSCCAVVLSEAHRQRLALYYVSEAPLDESALLAFMSGQLPLYMLPAALMRLEALPHNSSGKLDRKALPAPAASEPQVYVAPANELEQQLCALWQAALQCGQVGMTDDFFLLGGTSIKAISLCVGMGELMAAPVPVVQLLQSRTLKNLLAANERRLVLPLNRWAEGAPVVWMIHPALVGAEAFHAFAQPLQGRFNCYGVDNHNLYHQPAIDSLGDLAERYLNEMIAAGLLQGAGPVRILGWSLGGIIALEIAARLEARGCRNVQLYLLDSFYRQATAELPLDQLLPALGIEGEAATRAMAAGQAERRLSEGSLSRRLQTTKVTLFKATERNPQLPEAVTAPLLAVADNGLGAVCERLRVIPLACHHHNILLCEEAIGQALNDDV